MVPPLTIGFCMQNSNCWTRMTSLYGSQTWPVVLCMQNSVISARILVSMGPSPHLWFLHAKQRLLDKNNKSLLVPDFTCRFVHAKQRDYHHNYLSLLVPALICDFWMLNSDFRTRYRSLYGSLISSVALSTHNSVLSTRKKRLYWFYPSPVVFACKTATAGPEWQVSMGPRHDLSFCACTTACLASELLVSLGPSLHLWFLHAKQRLLDQNH